MKSLAILNQKGGVGKTTTAVNLSAALSDAGHRVCLIDMDPQAHASLHLGVSLEDEEFSVYDLLVSEQTVDQVARPISSRLTLLPAHLNLAAADTELASEVGREMILRNKLHAWKEHYDYILLDCPPSLGTLTLNALTAVDEVLLPLQPHYLALHGLSKLLGTIELVSSRLNPGLRLTGVVFCMVDAATRLANEVMQDVGEFFASNQESNRPWATAHRFRTTIRRNIRLAEAPSFGQPIFQYSPGCNGSQDYLALAEELQKLHGFTTASECLARAA